jgi:hypothetical protein
MTREYFLRDPKGIRNPKVPLQSEPGLPGFEPPKWCVAMLPTAIGDQEVHVWYPVKHPKTLELVPRAYLKRHVLFCHNQRARFRGQWWPLSVEGFLLVIEVDKP